jgi:hypothetical protein
MRVEVREPARGFLIVPNSFIDLSACVTDKDMRGWSRKRFYMGYYRKRMAFIVKRIRTGAIQRKLRKLAEKVSQRVGP